jgi:hypothetical protein
MKKGRAIEVRDPKVSADQVDLIRFESYQKALWGITSSPPGCLGNDGDLFSQAKMLHDLPHSNNLIIVVKPPPSKKHQLRTM